MDFWAYACINCQRANTHLTALYDRYADYGLQVVGVHAPEYAFEHDAKNVQAAAKEQNIHYPVAQDNNFTTWRAFNNRYWPAHYLVDHGGQVRQIHEGEGAYAETEQLVRELLTQANPGITLPAPVETGTDTTASAASEPVVADRNPETYLGTDRAKFSTNRGYTPGEHDFGDSDAALTRPSFRLSGKWSLARNRSHQPEVPDASRSVSKRR